MAQDTKHWTVQGTGFQNTGSFDELKAVIHLLKCGESLPAQYRDHALKGDFVGARECHIQPDWLLIYEVDDGELVLTLVRTGSHAQLFGM